MATNLVDGSVLDSDFTAICNAIRAKAGTSGAIAYTPGNTSAITTAIANIPSGGGVSHTFTETLLADDSSNTGTLDFNGADYHDYPLLKCVIYDTSDQEESIQLVTPGALDAAFQYFSSGICFGRYASSKYAYYTPNGAGNWVQGYTSSLYCKKVYGLTGQGCTISVTNLYIAQSNSAIDQGISYAGDLSDFDCIVAVANNSTSDCVPCEYILSGYGDGTLKEFSTNFANSWNNTRKITFTEHTISSYYWFSVDGVKFT